MKFFRYCFVFALGWAPLIVMTPSKPVFAQSACGLIDNDIARLQCYDERERALYGQTQGTETITETITGTIPETTAPDAKAQREQAEPAAALAAEPEIKLEMTERELMEIIARAIENREAGRPSQPDSDESATTVYVERAGENPLPEEIHSVIAEISQPLRGGRIFKFENGERWQETRNYQGLDFRVGADVHLKKGWFNGYNMISGRNAVRVVRVPQ